MIKCVDISKHNGIIDFNSLLENDIKSIIIRAGYGSSTQDKNFSNNIENALKLGFKVGLYWFGYAYTIEQAKQEALYCDKVISTYKNDLSLPVFYDWEEDSYNYAKRQGITVNKTLCSNITLKFCETLENLGYFVGVYSNIDYLNRFYNENIKTRFSLWVAQWANNCTYNGNYDIWQFTDNLLIDGKKFDGNYIKTDIIQRVENFYNKNCSIENNEIDKYKKALEDIKKIVNEV